MGIVGECRGGLCMAKLSCNVSDWSALHEQMSGECVAEIVEAKSRETSDPEYRAEYLGNDRRVRRRVCSRREYPRARIFASDKSYRFRLCLQPSKGVGNRLVFHLKALVML